MIKKADIILIAVFVALGVFCSVYILVNNDPGTSAIVSVEGQEYGTYDLAKDKTVTIRNNNHTNKITIKSGKVSMDFSDCHNQVCVEHAPISKSGETIVCLPNKVIIEIKSTEDNSKYDSISK